MSRAYKCDRCGSYYTNNFNHLRNYSINDLTRNFTQDPVEKSPFVDLCDNCQNDLDALMKQFLDGNKQ